MAKDIYLTPHFTLKEMTVTNVKLGYVDKIRQTQPNEQVMENLTRVCQWLEMLRKEWNERYGEGNDPVIVNSGYRCQEVNRLVGGRYVEPPHGMCCRYSRDGQGTAAALRHHSAGHQRHDASGF